MCKHVAGAVNAAPRQPPGMEGDRRAELERIIFFIRHAESRWNRAQAENDFLSMLWENDHGLTEDGARSAAALRERVRDARRAESEPGRQVEQAWTRLFLQPDAVFCSPFTRAIETACLALKDIVGTGEVTLIREVREQKNLGGADSTGVACGAAIRRHVEDDIRAIFESSGEEAVEQAVQEFRGTRLNTSEVEEEWWGPVTGDCEADFDDRLDALMGRLKEVRGAGGGGVAVVMGHSHFFRAMFDRLLSGCEKTSPDSAKFRSLRTKVLPYCGVVGTRIQWDESGKARIAVAVPLFGTELTAPDSNSRSQGGCICGRGQSAATCCVS